MTVCKVPAKRFAKLVDPPLHKINQAARSGGTVANIDLGEYGVLNEYQTLDHVRVPEPLMDNLGVGGVSDHGDIDVIEAVQVSSGTSATVDGERVPVEARENPVEAQENEGEGDQLPVRKPEKKGAVRQFGQFALYTGMAVGVGLALKQLFGGGDRAL